MCRWDYGVISKERTKIDDRLPASRWTDLGFGGGSMVALAGGNLSFGPHEIWARAELGLV